jgi:sugar (pentulose or hexulose) kinase
MLRILGVDVGTTAMKMAVFRAAPSGGAPPEGMECVGQFSKEYSINSYNGGAFGDIEQEKWVEAFRAGCRALSDAIAGADAVAIAGTTPGLTAMDEAGRALYPAILMLDQRSRRQAQEIVDTIGLAELLAKTGNMPVAGGCSLASILWLRDNEPEAFKRTACFGHTNTYMAKWLTGSFAIDPSSASLTALYNTAANDLKWNGDIAGAFGLRESRLPRLMQAFDSPGRMLPGIARELGFRKEPAVVIGGNDAVLAAYSAGVREPGEVINVNGTCEITLVCLPECYGSTRYNVRAHVLPQRWLTLYVMNAGGLAYEWFKGLFCRELTDEQFYGEFVPSAVERWLEKPSPARYLPYLMGSRYSLSSLRAEFTGLTRQSTREELCAAMVRGLCEYQREHLKDIALEQPLRDIIYVTGGANTPAIIRAKQRWMRPCAYEHREQSSVQGAALLAYQHLTGRR